jgi:hypothetical protein
VLAQVAIVDPVPPRLLNAGVPRDLQTICLKCLEKEPARRYQTAEDLAKEFGRFLRNEPILAQPPEPSANCGAGAAGVPPWPHPGFTLLVGVTGATGVLWQWQRAQAANQKNSSRQPETRRNLYAADMALAFEAFARGDRGRARHLLASYLPDPGASATGSTRVGMALSLGAMPGRRAANPRTPSRRGGDFGLLAGRTMGGVRDVQGGLQVWESTGQRAVLTTNLQEGRINCAGLLPTGEFLAHTTAGAMSGCGIRARRPGTVVGTLAQPEVSELAFAPDGKRLATANGMEVAVWDIETRQPSRSFPAAATDLIRATLRFRRTARFWQSVMRMEWCCIATWRPARNWPPVGARIARRRCQRKRSRR